MMLSLRALTRAVPKTLFHRSSARCLSSVSRPALYRPVWQPATRITYPAFSTSSARREPAGECKDHFSARPHWLTSPLADQELSAKIEQEYQLEVENNDSSKFAPLNDYLSDSGFEITDIPGTHEVTLTKTFGNEQYASPQVHEMHMALTKVEESRSSLASPTSTISTKSSTSLMRMMHLTMRQNSTIARTPSIKLV